MSGGSALDTTPRPCSANRTVGVFSISAVRSAAVVGFFIFQELAPLDTHEGGVAVRKLRRSNS